MNNVQGGEAGDGRWKVQYGNLYASEGDGELELISFRIYCNKEFNHEKGDLPFFYVEGTNHCRCGGSPILVIEGTEYSIYNPD